MERGEESLVKDIEYLKAYRKQLSDSLADGFKVTDEIADKLLELFEVEDLIKIEAPEYQEKPASILTKDRHVVKNELSMTSHKMGNVVLNTYLDWRGLASAALGVIETGAGIDMEHPVLTAIGVFQILFSVSELEDISIDENGTAIIMSLQEHRKHKAYMTDEESCMKEANSILVSHGYDEMDEKTYQNKIKELISCQCIDVRDGMIKLKEKVIMHY